MMSISPHPGQPTESMLDPSIQNAGQRPCPDGSFIRAATVPGKCIFPRLTIRQAEV